MARDIARDDALDEGHLRPDGREAPSHLRLGPGVVDHDSEVNPWAWVEAEQDEDTDVDISGCQVTAVLVTLDAERWLPATLAGLAALTHRPDRLIAIDNQSSDGTRRLLNQAAAVGLLDAVYTGDRSKGFGASVAAALSQDRKGRRESDPDPEHRWLWLLHDDAVPAPNALSQLLSHVVTNPEIDITGPKLLLPRRRSAAPQLSEVGVSISGTGRRELMLDGGEIDQGQRDEPERKLGVSTCGMLVRQVVWHKLGGLDPAVPVFRDGVEFGWRAQLSGYHVLTTPAATMIHRQVGRAGLRPHGVIGRRPAQLDRELGMLVIAGHARGLQFPFVWLRLVWSCLVHAVGYLLGKVPGRSWDELLAMGSFVRHPRLIRSFRRRLHRLSVVPEGPDVVEALRPPWWSSLRVASEIVSGAVSDRYRSVAGEADAASLDELTGDDFSAPVEEPVNNPWLSPVVIAGVLTAVGSLVAARSLVGVGALTGPALLPAPDRLQSLWSSVASPIFGAPYQLTPPWLALVAIGSTVFAGRPEWFVTVLLCAVVPLSLVSVYPVVRKVIHDRRVRLWVALTYALLPVLLGGTNQGRLSLSVFGIALPLLVLAARALVLRRPRAPEAWRGGWGAGVVLVVLTAFEPSMLIVAVVGGAIGAVALRRSPRKVGRIGIALAMPLVVLAPWWPGAVASWGRLFAGPDAVLGGAPNAPEVWRLLFGRVLGEGLPPLWLGIAVFGTIWLVALVGLARRPRSRAVVAAWVTGLLALAAAILCSRMVVPVPPVGAEIRPEIGSYLLLAFGALVMAAGVGVDGLSSQLAARSFSMVQPAAVIAGALVALVTLGAGAWWVWAGAQHPIQRIQLDALPPYVVNAMQGESKVRVLAVDLTGPEVGFAVLADDQLRLGDADRGYPFGGSTQARDQAEDLVIRLTAGTADADISSQLRDLAIGYVWVSGADDEEAARIDNTPGLGAASGNARGTVWQLQPAVARTVVATGRELTPVTSGTVLPPGAAGRQLRLGEPADGRWRATVDDQPLPAVAGSWQQVFEIPPAGGRLEYRYSSATLWWLIGSGILLVIAAVFAAPAIRRPEVRDPARLARRTATMSGLEL
ncbi:MAG TPA: glycosyltransferase [Propionibacteriaceae bacterium]|nr:glycosyltransferase [Propionibacteriaceae bacterium]